MSYEKKNIRFLAAVNYELTIRKMNKQELASIVGMSKSSLYDKLKHPEKFFISEARLLCDVLKLSPEMRAYLL